MLRLDRTVTSPPLPYPGEDAAAEAERLEKMPAGNSQTWLLLEFCDKPCLQVCFRSCIGSVPWRVAFERGLSGGHGAKHADVAAAGIQPADADRAHPLPLESIMQLVIGPSTPMGLLQQHRGKPRLQVKFEQGTSRVKGKHGIVQEIRAPAATLHSSAYIAMPC